jgi:hypothetical protein
MLEDFSGQKGNLIWNNGVIAETIENLASMRVALYEKGMRVTAEVSEDSPEIIETMLGPLDF